MREAIRRFLQKRGYDIVKTDDYGAMYPDVSSENGLSLFRTPIGAYYLPRNNKKDEVAYAIRRGKIFENEVVELASRYIRNGTIVLDVGANYGQMSVEFSKQVGGNGSVYAFEGQRLVFEILKKNIDLNDCKNIKPVFGAVYDREGVKLVFPEPDFKRFRAYGSYGIDPDVKDGNKVESLTIDSIEYDKPVSFLKIDIQGSDLFALRGAVKTIQKHKMPIIFEFEQQFQDSFKTSFQDYVDFVQKIDYKFETTVLGINYLIVPR